MVWDVMAVVLAVIFSITISLQAAFMHASIPLWAINGTLDVFFLADM